MEGNNPILSFCRDNPGHIVSVWEYRGKCTLFMKKAHSRSTARTVVPDVDDIVLSDILHGMKDQLDRGNGDGEG